MATTEIRRTLPYHRAEIIKLNRKKILNSSIGYASSLYKLLTPAYSSVSKPPNLSKNAKNTQLRCLAAKPPSSRTLAQNQLALYPTAPTCPTQCLHKQVAIRRL
jgi:hypothetical protein